MLVFSALLASTLALPATGSLRRAPTMDVRLDQRRNEIVVTVGPFHVPVAMTMQHMDMMMMAHAESLVGVFDWPASRAIHGVKLAVVDGRGNLLPRRLLHHTYMVNFDRRQLVHAIMERPFSFGQETADLATPATIGMPMVRGHRLGVIVMWHNETGADVDGAYVRYTFVLNPARQRPAPLPVMPFFVDVQLRPGGLDTFSVAPGGRTVTREFTVPISGRLIAAGGHLHDHAVHVRLSDALSGRILTTVRARRNAEGEVTAVSRELLGLWGRGPHLVPGRRYRLEVLYDNPTADTLAGMMGMMGGLFVPDRPGDWPAVDRAHPDWSADLAGISGAAALLAARR